MGSPFGNNVGWGSAEKSIVAVVDWAGGGGGGSSSSGSSGGFCVGATVEPRNDAGFVVAGSPFQLEKNVTYVN